MREIEKRESWMEDRNERGVNIEVRKGVAVKKRRAIWVESKCSQLQFLKVFRVHYLCFPVLPRLFLKVSALLLNLRDRL